MVILDGEQAALLVFQLGSTSKMAFSLTKMAN